MPLKCEVFAHPPPGDPTGKNGLVQSFDVTPMRGDVWEMFHQVFAPEGARLTETDIGKVLHQLSRNLPRRIETVAQDELRRLVSEHVRPPLKGRQSPPQGRQPSPQGRQPSLKGRQRPSKAGQPLPRRRRKR